MTSHINVALARFEVHGSRPFQRLAQRREVLRRRSAADDAHRGRPQRRPSSREFAERWGWQHHTTDWHAAVTSDEIGLVDIGTPNNVHAEQAIAALEAGKHVACEKPLAGTLSDARAMVAAAAGAPGTTSVWFNYRRVPAVALAHRLVAAGRIGRIYHVRAAYLQSWGGPDTPLLWRFQGDIAGSGAHGDLNAHIIDSVRFVTGEEIVTVEGAIEHTFIEERAVLEGADGWRDRRRRRQHDGQQGGEHGRRRRAVPRPAERRRSRQLRSHPPRDRIPQREPLRDPRRSRSPAVQLRTDERVGVLRPRATTPPCRGGRRSTSPAAATGIRMSTPGGPTATDSATSTASSIRRATS